MEKYKLKNNKELIIKKEFHQEDFNPRLDDNIGTIVSWHTRYSLGDKTNDENFNINKNNYSSAEEAIISNSNKDDIILPLYIYDHSGIQISTTPYNDRWDSGQFGFIKVSRDKVRKEFGVKRVTNSIVEKVTKILQSEVELYSMYLEGEVYSSEIIDNSTGESDYCSGFYGHDIFKNGILEILAKEDQEYLKNKLNENNLVTT